MTFVVGTLLYGGAMFGLGGLVVLRIVFGPTLWWDATAEARRGDR